MILAVNSLKEKVSIAVVVESAVTLAVKLIVLSSVTVVVVTD